MIYRVLGALLVLMIVAAAWVLLDRQQILSSSAPLAQEKPEDATPGYSALRAEIIETGTDGRPMYVVRAEHIRQLPEAQSIMLDTVRMEMHDQSGQRWTGRADYGQIFQDRDEVQLTGDVLLSGILPGSDQSAEISTERLLFNTEQEIVKTGSPVTLSWSGQRIQSKGLSANLKDQSLRLESEVHGLFAPQTRSP